VKKNWADMSWSEVSLGRHDSKIWAEVSIFLGRIKRPWAEVSDIHIYHAIAGMLCDFPIFAKICGKKNC
jgi:hypothetical protein